MNRYPSAAIIRRVVIIGAAGNVGKGILQTFCACSDTWDVIAIDPAFKEEEIVGTTGPSESKFKLNTRIKSKIEDIDDEIFQSWFFLPLGENKHGHEYDKHHTTSQHHHHHIEIIVTNDNGNRDEYAV